MSEARPPGEPIVAFDFDGTITRRDTLLPFLLHTFGPVTVARVSVRHSVALGRVAAGGGDRDATKVAYLDAMLRGVSRHRLELAAERFADRAIAQQLRTDTLDRLRWHRGAGHHVVVVSASPELVVRPIAEAIGAHEVLATRIEFDDRGVCTGRLVGRNVRAAEKAHRLRARYGDGVTLEWAYGDSAGDDDMLALAANPVFVRKVRISAVPEGHDAR